LILNLFATIVAFILIGCGLILLPLPIPLGAILILCGTALAVTVSPTTRARVKRFRARNGRLEQVIRRVKPYLPKFLHRPIDDSDPGGI
jgi:hypothetical protein